MGIFVIQQYPSPHSTTERGELWSLPAAARYFGAFYPWLKESLSASQNDRSDTSLPASLTL